VLVGGFVENYMIWTYHGEKASPPTENPLNEIIEDVEFDKLFDAYDNFCEGGGDDDGVGRCYGDGVGKGPIDGGSNHGSADEFDDGDFLSQLLRQTKVELLVGSAKGLANFKTVKKLVGKIYTSNQKGVQNTGPCFVSYS
jgi:hypothetical protein